MPSAAGPFLSPSSKDRVVYLLSTSLRRQRAHGGIALEPASTDEKGRLLDRETTEGRLLANKLVGLA